MEVEGWKAGKSQVFLFFFCLQTNSSIQCTSVDRVLIEMWIRYMLPSQAAQVRSDLLEHGVDLPEECVHYITSMIDAGQKYPVVFSSSKLKLPIKLVLEHIDHDVYGFEWAQACGLIPFGNNEITEKDYEREVHRLPPGIPERNPNTPPADMSATSAPPILTHEDLRKRMQMAIDAGLERATRGLETTPENLESNIPEELKHNDPRDQTDSTQHEDRAEQMRKVVAGFLLEPAPGYVICGKRPRTYPGLPFDRKEPHKRNSAAPITAFGLHGVDTDFSQEYISSGELMVSDGSKLFKQILKAGGVITKETPSPDWLAIASEEKPADATPL
jgi:hypothetical protein